MKAALSSLLTNKSLSLHHSPSSLSRSIFHSKFLSTPPISLYPKHHANSTNFSRIHTGFAPIMAASYKPEQARAPPALPLPTPLLTKVSLFLPFTLNFCFLFYKNEKLHFYFLVRCRFSSRLGCAKYRWRPTSRGISRTLARRSRRPLQRAPSLFSCPWVHAQILKLFWH